MAPVPVPLEAVDPERLDPGAYYTVRAEDLETRFWLERPVLGEVLIDPVMRAQLAQVF